MATAIVYGIGDPLIDLNYQVTDAEVVALGLEKGVMTLLDQTRRAQILALLQTKSFLFHAGGDCPNVMVNLALLGTPTAFSGKMGYDEFAKMYEERLAQCGVISALAFGQEVSGSSIIMVHPDAERTMATYLGASKTFAPEHVSWPLLEKSASLFFTGYIWDSHSQKKAILQAVTMANALGKLVVFDAADPVVARNFKPDILNLLGANVDIAFANQEEARALFGSPSDEANAYKLAALVDCGAVKAGADGAFVFLRGQVSHIPAISNQPVIDTTGAGDAFAAGFLHRLLDGRLQPENKPINLDQFSLTDIEQAGRMANLVASTVISRTGAQLTVDEGRRIRSLLLSGSYLGC